MDIKLFWGFDTIKFGLTREEVETILGNPTHKETETFPDGTEQMVYDYEHLDVDLTFASDDDYLLGTITFYGEDAIWNGEKWIGLNESEFILKKDAGDLDDLMLADDFEEANAKDYYSESKGISFWIQDGIVDSITIFPRYNENDEPVWP